MGKPRYEGLRGQRVAGLGIELRIDEIEGHKDKELGLAMIGCKFGDTKVLGGAQLEG